MPVHSLQIKKLKIIISRDFFCFLMYESNIDLFQKIKTKIFIFEYFPKLHTPWGKTKKKDFFLPHRRGQEFLGMGCLKMFWIKGQKHRRPPYFRGFNKAKRYIVIFSSRGKIYTLFSCSNVWIKNFFIYDEIVSILPS